MRTLGLGTSLAAAMMVVSVAAVPSKASVDQKPRCRGRAATIAGSARNDVLQGSSGPDVIVGFGGDDRIESHDGKDLVCAGPGHDHVDGGYGRDIVWGGAGRDDLRGGPHDDLLVGQDDEDFLYGGDGSDSDTLVGGSAYDALFGGDGSFDEDYLFGGGGQDFLKAGDGGGSADVVIDGSDQYVDGGIGGNDAIWYLFSPVPVEVDYREVEPTFEVVLGSRFSDSIAGAYRADGDEGDDSLIGSEATNSLFGREGTDTLAGLGGNDLVSGGAGNDTLDGGEGRDTASFGDAAASVSASLITGVATGADSDSLTSIESILGSAFDDFLEGDGGDNSLIGGGGYDEAHGRAGDDYIEAEAGSGGEGTDDCYFEDCEPPPKPIADPCLSSWITYPRAHSNVAHLEVVEGTFSAGICPRPSKIHVGLRLITPAGCFWWNSRLSKLVFGGCGRPVWNAATKEGKYSGTFRLAITEDLPAGRYGVVSRAVSQENCCSERVAQIRDVLTEFDLE